MPLKLTGGSVTLSVTVLAVVWTIRSLRDKRRHRNGPNLPAHSSSKYFAEMSLEAIALMVHLNAIPYYVIDVRSTEEAAAAPLAPWVTPAVSIPEPQLQTGLKQPAVWHSFATASRPSSFTSSPQAPTSDEQEQQQQRRHEQQVQLPLPSRRHLLLLVSDSPEQQQLAISRAAAAGFERVAVPSCGIEQLLDVVPTGNSSSSSFSRDLQVMAAAAAAAVQFPAIHADALTVLLGLVSLPEGVWQLVQQTAPPVSTHHHQQQQQQAGRSPGHTRSNSGSGGSMLAASDAAAAAAAEGAAGRQQQQQRLLLLDVRRHDERTLYGAIPGAHHVPVDELASALQLQPAAFRRRYHCEPPQRAADVLVLHSRASSRAQWAAQICLDAGCKFVFVYPEGVLGWSFGTGVDAYAAYEQGSKPPPPDARLPREPDVAAGVMELQQLGLVPLLMQQHGVASSR